MKLLPLSALVASLALAGCQTMDEAPASLVGEASLMAANGTPAGTARLFDTGSEVTLSVSLSALPEGTHGVHLHTTGACEAPSFTSAGPHLNPANRQHGFENPQGAHLGDLPNAMVDASGNATVSATLHGTPATVLQQIFDADGTAVVVHATADDYRTDPAGNSGGRIACGVLTPA